jgi:hypothetical protein
MSVESKIDETLDVLASIGMPRAQINDRSALCLLALLDLKPSQDWNESSNPLMGITPIMDWARDNYVKGYAPNTRETFRRQSMHQFVEAGIAAYNPDNPDRPVNSPKAVYQVSDEFLTLARAYDTSNWDAELRHFKKAQMTLVAKYAKNRELNMIPVALKDGSELRLSPGEHSQLIKEIIEEFGARFAPGSKLVYVGDTGNKYGYYDKGILLSISVDLDDHGKMPDVILYDEKQSWLFLIESVTSHGPVDGKRYLELNKLFEDAEAGLVFVTALPSFTQMARFSSEIAWETEVWVADNPSHLIHYNGNKFIGPYQ